MHIIGISAFYHDSAAALVDDGEIIAAAQEERFTRKKHDASFPENALKFCLDRTGITLDSVEYVAFYDKPFLKFERLLETYVAFAPRGFRSFAMAMPLWLKEKLFQKNLLRNHLREFGSACDWEKKLLFTEHHQSHAASAFFPSPFEEAVVLTMDGVGEWATTSMALGSGNNLEMIKEIHFPHSLGLLYSAFTAFLGFEVNEGEYKVMGMAPYGSPVYTDKVRSMVFQYNDGSFWLDPSYFSFHHSTSKSYTKKFVQMFGEPRKPDIEFFTKTSGYPSYYGERPRNFDELCRYNQYYADVAASIQLVVEEIILNLAKALHKKSGQRNLCLAGGVALNSAANGRILRETPFEEIYIQPSAGDGGGALGAALYVWHTALGNSERHTMKHAYWGQSYGNDEILTAINDVGLTGQLIEDNSKLIEISVDRLIKGKVTGWFQGRFEWGPRALGNRSILADPRSPEMKDVVNNKIKFREPFRPFAPAVLAHESENYFELENPERHLPARFMLLVVPVRPDKQSSVPAVNHLGTARIQTVYPEDNSLYYQLIEEFGNATGVPVLMNTSFNVRGEPIVNTPSQALRTFSESGIDSLVMGNYIVDKS